MASTFLLVTIMLALLCHTQAAFSPRSSKAGLIAQAKIAAQKSITATQATLQVAKKYAKGSTKAPAETCIETCGDAIDNLNQCLDVLKSFNPGRKEDLQTWGSAAETDVVTCDDEFEDASGEPAELKKATQNASKLISNLLAIINSL